MAGGPRTGWLQVSLRLGPVIIYQRTGNVLLPHINTHMLALFPGRVLFNTHCFGLYICCQGKYFN